MYIVVHKMQFVASTSNAQKLHENKTKTETLLCLPQYENVSKYTDIVYPVWIMWSNCFHFPLISHWFSGNTKCFCFVGLVYTRYNIFRKLLQQICWSFVVNCWTFLKICLMLMGEFKYVNSTTVLIKLHTVLYNVYLGHYHLLGICLF